MERMLLEMEDMDGYDSKGETEDMISKVQMLSMKIEKEETIDVSAPLLQPYLPSCPEALTTHSAAISIKTEAKDGTITTPRSTRSQPAISTCKEAVGRRHDAAVIGTTQPPLVRHDAAVIGTTQPTLVRRRRHDHDAAVTTTTTTTNDHTTTK